VLRALEQRISSHTNICTAQAPVNMEEGIRVDWSRLEASKGRKAMTDR